MIGFEESDVHHGQDYGLMSTIKPDKSRLPGRLVVSLLAGAGVVGGLGLLSSASSSAPSVLLTTLPAVPPAVPGTGAPAAVDPCPTKPFGQCAGMNFSNADAGLTFNFTTGASPFACCPAGASCVSFGPVWGMCMPSWGAP